MINWLRILLVVFPLALGSAPGFASSPDPDASVSAAVESAAPPATNSAPITYTSVKGDSFTSVSAKYGCTVHALKKLNGIKVTHLKPGTTLKIPASKSLASKAAKKKKDGKSSLADSSVKKTHHHSPVAQPVQDFDVAPSLYASCPTPPSNGSADDLASPAEDTEAPPPANVAAQEPSEQMPVTENHRMSLLPVPGLPPGLQSAPVAPPSPTAKAPQSVASMRATAPANPLVPAAPKKTFATALADFFGGGSHASESGEWGNRFLVETRNLAAQGICYDGSWRPDGEPRRWEMDCSNTTRYLYQVTAGIELPRTASDQYYYLHLQDKAWDVPMTGSGFADTSFLRGNLKPGDLLFWENTYRPERQPPITHVMIFLGTDARGRWLMAGSQGSKGFYNRRHSGPDVYVFDPTHAVGGYTTWLGLVHHHGRFVAYGRPLEADVKKLSVATND